MLSGEGLLGHVLEAYRDGVGLFQRAAREAPAVRMRFLKRRFIVLSEPALVERFLVHQHAAMSKQTPGFRCLRLVLGDGLLTAEIDSWRAKRRRANPVFHTNHVEALAGWMNGAARDFTATHTGTVDIGAACTKLALRIAGETLFSHDVSDAGGLVYRALRQSALPQLQILAALPGGAERIPTPGNLRLHRAVRDLDTLVYGIIDERRADDDPGNDLLGLFLRDDIDRTELRDEVLTMLIAGHETVANALTWALYLLAAHPQVAGDLCDEITGALGDDDLAMADLKRLPLLRAVVAETLRLYPSIWLIGRMTETSTEIGDVAIPAGLAVNACTYALHRHPDYWSNAEDFVPERFLGDGPGVPTGAYFPFGLGQRKCIGDRFAELELAVVLSRVVRDLDLDLVDDNPPVPVGNISLTPRGSLRLDLRLKG